MERVTGIGGFFFRSRAPKELAQWYLEHLSIGARPEGEGGAPWEQQAGPTVFTPFAHDSTYFGRAEQSFMLNLRVADIEAMAAQLRAAGVEVALDPETYPYGRFARIHDPEGNPIELWQAPA